MTPDAPIHPRQALEASLTALLLGELPPDQAEFLQRAITQDPELAKQYERLKQTIQLVRETEITPAKESAAQSTPLKLPEHRRQELLQRFKTITPKPYANDHRREISWLVPLAAAFVIVALLSAALLPALSKSKAKSQLVSRASRNYAKLEEKEIAGNAREELDRLNSGQIERQLASKVENDLAQVPAAPKAKSPAAKPNQTAIVLPAETKPLGSSTDDGARTVPELGWSLSVTKEGFYDNSNIQSPPPGNVTLSAGLPADALALSRNTAGGGIGGAGAKESELGLANGDSDQLRRLMLRQPNLPAQTGVPGQAVSSADNTFNTFGLPRGLSAGNTLAKNEARDQESQSTSDRFAFEPSLKLTDPQGNSSSPVEFGGVMAHREAEIVTTAPASAAEEPQKVEMLAENAQSKVSAFGDSPIVGGRFLADSKNGKQIPADGNKEVMAGIILPSIEPNLAKDKSVRLNFDPAPQSDLRDDTSTPLQEGKRLFEIGKLDEAEAKLQQATKQDPKNQAAYYYLDLANEARAKEVLQKQDAASKSGLVGIVNTKSPSTVTNPVWIGGMALAGETEKGGSAGKKLAVVGQELDQLQRGFKNPASDIMPAKPTAPAPIPQPEVQTRENFFSTFSLNVSDVSFKLAAASLEKGVLPEPASIRSEEFINAFDYRDPEPAPGAPIAFAWERAQYPFAQNRDLLRFSIKTAAQGRQPGRPLNLVLLLDNSGSMERADRVHIIHEALRVLATKLQAQDTLSVVTFARTPRLWLDGVPGTQAAQVAEQLSALTPEGGTNLEEAMNLAYQTALRHYLANGINRVVLLTDGAANLGDVEPDRLKKKVETNRKQGIALDCFGIGWEGYNDDLLEELARNSDGRYGFINTPEEAVTEFAAQLAGALQVAASDVKVQVEFNPSRVTAYRQVGYAKHQLTKEQFRDNTVDAAEIGAAESGNALYVIEANPRGEGPLATVRVRYKVPGTAEYHEHEWAVPYTGNAASLGQSSPALRLAATASAFSEWLASSPFAAEATPDSLLGYLAGIPDVYGADQRPKKLEWMIRQSKAIAGR